jgi:D-alanine-D-alanine ligase
MNIEIVTTLYGALKEEGFGSLDTCKNVSRAIEKSGHVVGLNVCRHEHDLLRVVDKGPDLVLLAVKYLSVNDGNDIWLSEYFENHGINFTGSLISAIDFDSDKVLAKLHLNKQGIKTAKFFTARPGQFDSSHELPISFPLFLKPLDSANGKGIDISSLVNNFEEFQRKLLRLSKNFGQTVLVEEYLDGPEFTCAIIKSNSHGLSVSVMEILPPKSKNELRIPAEQVKEEKTETLSKTEYSKLTGNIRQLAIVVFHHLGIRDFGRIDIITNRLGECFFMKADLVPGMAPGSSYFPKTCQVAQNMSYDKVVQLIIEGGISRVPLDLPDASVPPPSSKPQKSKLKFRDMVTYPGGLLAKLTRSRRPRIK